MKFPNKKAAFRRPGCLVFAFFANAASRKKCTRRANRGQVAENHKNQKIFVAQKQRFQNNLCCIFAET
jgi:hypothetical protein